MLMSTHGPDIDLPPDPAALIESMRAFGYSLPTALADLIDNSISAQAREIDVEFNWAGRDSTVVIADDGDGMDEATLMDAMRLGSRSPLEERAPTDLGRFGLGLKSAAWSQARSLTVITRSEWGPVLLRRWDLDHVTTKRRWSLLSSGTPFGEQLRSRLDGARSGTLVVLEHLDRLVSDVPASDDLARERFFTAVARASDHLSMVFHRFLSGRGAVALRVNGRKVEPWDPFLEDHPATQRLPREWLGSVAVSPFVLPHWSKLDRDEHATTAGASGWNAQQGFYVYRARRLLVAGDWLGLRRMQQEEHYKLGRIRIDLDNAMDELWQIDVRKATARIPGELQPELHRVAQATRRRAAEVYRFRGKAIARQVDRHRAINFVWERATRRGGTHVFRINRRHPVLRALHDRGAETASAVERALSLAEENLPVEAIVMDAREHPDEDRGRPHAGDTNELSAMLREAHAAMVREGTDVAIALRALAAVEPFDAHPELIELYREELNL
jgi:hypothetical protein